MKIHNELKEQTKKQTNKQTAELRMIEILNYLCPKSLPAITVNMNMETADSFWKINAPLPRLIDVN